MGWQRLWGVLGVYGVLMAGAADAAPPEPSFAKHFPTFDSTTTQPVWHGPWASSRAFALAPRGAWRSAGAYQLIHCRPCPACNRARLCLVTPARIDAIFAQLPDEPGF